MWIEHDHFQCIVIIYFINYLFNDVHVIFSQLIQLDIPLIPFTNQTSQQNVDHAHHIQLVNVYVF